MLSLRIVHNNSMITFSEVSKSFGAKTVLDELSFAVATGEIVILLGPNGAGKSTAMALLTGLEQPTSGQIKINDHSAGSLAARQQFAFVPQNLSFPAHASGSQVIGFLAAHSQNAKDFSRVREAFLLRDFLQSPVRVMSGGQKRLLALAGAFSRGVPLLILDEPTVGLDFEARAVVYANLENFAQAGGTVFMTTHFLAEAERLATRILALNKGKIVESGSPTEIKRRFGLKRISFRSAGEPPGHLSALRGRESGTWCLDVADSNKALRELLEWGGAEEIEVQPMNLEDVFTRVLDS